MSWSGAADQREHAACTRYWGTALGGALPGGGQLASNERQELFDRLGVDRQSGTVERPTKVDLDPDVLYGRTVQPDRSASLRRERTGPDSYAPEAVEVRDEKAPAPR